ncbi:hypothetical protein BC941DRAFT_414352 [Chlamydoabsidia padenii]|nr:hypothetical protein BC941DRAFT_414352 [Chlamydoabsidia padenii]
MGMAFIAYCGYLINQLVTDRRLLISISEQIPSTGYPAPDIETCSQKSTFTIAKCTLVSMNWTSTDIPGCAPYIIDGSLDDPNTHCKVFTAKNHPLQFRINGTDDTSIQRVDLYWRVDNVTSFEEATLAIPTLAIQFYAASFSPWRQSDIVKIPQQQDALDTAKHGKFRATTLQNYTTNIYFTPNKYRAIPPRDGNSLFGLAGNYVDIESIATVQHNWPLHSNPALDSGEYHGFFAVQLATPTIDVKMEQRQHTILSALALAGGAYGILVTLFIAIYGTPRISAFGFIHHVDNWCGQCKLKWSNTTVFNNNNSLKNNDDIKDVHHAHPFKHTDSDINSTHSSLEHLTEYADTTEQPIDSSDKRYSVSGLQPVVSDSSLENRIDYLEGILREYFVNVDYLDGLRHRRLAGKETNRQDHTKPSPPLPSQQQNQHSDTIDNDYSIALRNI